VASPLRRRQGGEEHALDGRSQADQDGGHGDPVGVDAGQGRVAGVGGRVDPAEVRPGQGVDGVVVELDPRAVGRELLVVGARAQEDLVAGRDRHHVGHGAVPGDERGGQGAAVGGEAGAHLDEPLGLTRPGGQRDAIAALVAARLQGDELVHRGGVTGPVDELGPALPLGEPAPLLVDRVLPSHRLGHAAGRARREPEEPGSLEPLAEGQGQAGPLRGAAEHPGHRSRRVHPLDGQQLMARGVPAVAQAPQHGGHRLVGPCPVEQRRAQPGQAAHPRRRGAPRGPVPPRQRLQRHAAEHRAVVMGQQQFDPVAVGEVVRRRQDARRLEERVLLEGALVQREPRCQQPGGDVEGTDDRRLHRGPWRGARRGALHPVRPIPDRGHGWHHTTPEGQPLFRGLPQARHARHGPPQGEQEVARASGRGPLSRRAGARAARRR